MTLTARWIQRKMPPVSFFNKSLPEPLNPHSCIETNARKRTKLLTKRTSKLRDHLHQDCRVEVHHEVVWSTDWISKSDWAWDDSTFSVLSEELRSSESKPQSNANSRLMIIKCGYNFGWGETKKERDFMDAVSMIFLVGSDVHTSRSL